MEYVIGIDEVGRGPVAGPVTVCACAVKKGTNLLHLFPNGALRDSKKLSEKVRLKIVEQLMPYTESGEIVFGVGEVDGAGIDDIGISEAIRMAMKLALNKLHDQGISPGIHILLDGSLKADTSYSQETIIKGDEKYMEIALASIIAKVHRDSFMKKISDAYPAYGFANHVGYGTRAHYDAIKEHGLTPLHRKTFLTTLLNR
jgi:ribonuclease HII